MDAEQLGLGKIITTEQQRDAVHIAVAPVTAARTLQPGQRIKIIDSAATDADEGEEIGIVDPFLTERVRKGQQFWAWLKPGSITSLRHDWTHPEFAAAPFTTAIQASDRGGESRNWIAHFANGLDVTYDRMMKAARDYSECGQHFSRGGDFEGVSLPDEFWTHYAAVTGEVPNNTGSFFSCAC